MHSSSETSEARPARPAQPGPRRLIACNYCRLKKVRCNGKQPCKNCVDHGEVCYFVTAQRERRRKRNTHGNTITHRLARLEALLQALAKPAPGEVDEPMEALCGNDSDPDLRPETCSQAELIEESFSLTPEPIISTKLLVQVRDSPNFISRTYEKSQPFGTVSQRSTTSCEHETRSSLISPHTSLDHHLVALPDSARGSCVVSQHLGVVEPISNAKQTPKPLDEGSNGSEIIPDAALCNGKVDQERSSVYSEELSNWEYHGPTSYLSICSQPGIQWVTSRIGSCSFHESATTLTKTVTRRLKTQPNMLGDRVSEPDYDVARRYAKAYFEGSFETTFGIINSAQFLSRLQAHFRTSGADNDPAWYTLRNAVYASGSRIELSKTSSLRQACQTAWGYFGNALSRHTELLYFRTSLQAIQALTVMAYFTDNASTPCLEYMLSTIALRLACSKGLHRQAVSSWNISLDEQGYRNRLFWALYCLEKNSAARSGRPSMLNDNQISCPLPAMDSSTMPIDVAHCFCLVKLAQMQSIVSNTLSGPQTFQKSPQTLATMISELEDKFKELESCLEELVDLEFPTTLPVAEGGLSLQQSIYLRLSYYSLALSAHSFLSTPWSHFALKMKNCPEAHRQYKKSSEIVANAARNAIRACQYVQIDATTPLLLTFYGPIYAMINLFIHILNDPSHPLVRSDILLMEVGAAHFARLEYSAGVSLIFAKEIVSIVQVAVEHWESRLDSSSNNMNLHSQSFEEINSSDLIDVGDQLGNQEDMNSFKDACASNLFGLDFEHWSTLLPTPGFDERLPEFLDS